LLSGSFQFTIKLKVKYIIIPLKICFCSWNY